MIINATVTNNDHPRNHATLCRVGGWRLSPAYDLLPIPVVSLDRHDLVLTVSNFGCTASDFNMISNVPGSAWLLKLREPRSIRLPAWSAAGGLREFCGILLCLVLHCYAQLAASAVH